MTTVDNAITEIEKLLTDKNISLSDSDKKRLEQLLEDLRQTGYDEGYDDGYSNGYDCGYDFGCTPVD